MNKLLTLILIIILSNYADIFPKEKLSSGKNFTTDDRYSLERYLSIRGAGSPVYSYNGKQIFIKTSITGTSQIWMIEKPLQWPTQITYFQNRIKSYSYSPREDLIVFQKDDDGSERDQIYLMKPDGDEIKNITDNDDVKHRFGFWSETDDVFYYSSNEREKAYYDIYSYNYKTREKNIIFISDDRNYPSTVSPDGRYMIISRSYSNFDNDLFLLDLHTGELDKLTEYGSENEPSRTYAREWCKDSKGFYYISDYGRDFMNLGYYELSQKTFMYVDHVPDKNFIVNQENLNKDITQVEFSRDRSLIAYVLNYNGVDEIVIIDLLNKKEIQVPEKIKNCNINSLVFSNDGGKLLVAYNNYKSPTIVSQYEINTGSFEQVTSPSLFGISEDSFIEPELVTIKSFDDLEISGFLYLPHEAKMNSDLPCIIDIHGGPESQSDIGFNSLYQYYLSRGYAVLAPNVRGSRGKGKYFASLDNNRLRENSVADIAEFTKYLISTGYVNKEKIIVMGGSYGGYMALACLTLYPELFAAGISRVGISNFITFLSNTAEYRRENREAEYGSLSYDFGFLESISPINKVDRIKAPLLLIHGENDPRVPVNEAEQIYEAIKSKGGVVEFLKFEDEGHSLSRSDNRLTAYKKIVEFIDKHVEKE
ncbi:MAG: S9 family peptidase [Ignavibacteria bacterium]|nr:S9 family peptidase [Ignavibacteria bacterium]